MGRATRIAMLARLYVLLGKHPQYMTSNTGERIDRSLSASVTLGELDKTLLMAATEIDRLCGHTVMVLRGQMSTALLDALGVLDPDRIIAMFYALPDRRRKVVLRDPSWAYHIEHEPPGMADVLDATELWLTEDQRSAAERARMNAPLPNEVRERLERTERVMLRHQAGLPVMVTEQEQREIDESERAGKRLIDNVGLLVNEVSALPDPGDEKAFGRAIKRAVAKMS